MSSWNPFYLTVMVVLIIVVMAHLELAWNTHHSRCIMSLPKTFVKIASPKETFNVKSADGFIAGSSTDTLSKPVYIYNKNKLSRKTLATSEGFDINEYDKRIVHEHVASKIMNPVREIFNGIGHLSKTKTPIDTIYNCLGNSDSIIGNVNPLTYADDSGYRMLVPKGEIIEGFFANGSLFIV